MIKKVVNYLDKHRIILVFLILFLVAIIFLSINAYIFWQHKFIPLTCDRNTTKEVCKYQDMEIFSNPEKSLAQFNQKYQKKIDNLKQEYNLPAFNKYTAYFYYLASGISYQENKTNLELLNFYTIYIATYDLINFYKENSFYYDIFYSYKI